MASPDHVGFLIWFFVFLWCCVCCIVNQCYAKTQATLGLGSSTERAVLQCSVGHKSPIILCSLLPSRNETCSLDLKFDEDDDLVAFSVMGPRSIHLSGYFVANDGDHLRDEYESYPFTWFIWTGLSDKYLCIPSFFKKNT